MCEMAAVIKRGELILKSQPFAYVLCTEFRGLNCDFCLKKNDKLLKCTQCTLSFYCDRECQKNDWKNHKQECINLKRVSPLRPSDFVRMMAKIIHKLKTHSNENESVGNATRRFEDLTSHIDLIKSDSQRMDQFNTIKTVLNEFITPDDCPSAEELLEIFGKIVINSYSICDNEMQPIGVGLYLGASVFDHSCNPNATIVFDGSTVYVNAVEDIPQEDTSNIANNVFISYVDLLASTDERRRDLKSQYYFDCGCSKCKDEQMNRIYGSILCPDSSCTEPVFVKDDVPTCTKCGIVDFEIGRLLEANDQVENCKEVFEELKQLQKKNDYQKIFEVAEKCIEQAKLILHILNVHYVRILDFAFDACINLSKWQLACEIGQKLVRPYKYHYGNFHPNLGVHLLKVGKIELFVENLPQALKMLLEASDVITVTHSQYHNLYSICQDLLSQCQMELKLNKSLTLTDE